MISLKVACPIFKWSNSNTHIWCVSNWPKIGCHFTSDSYLALSPFNLFVVLVCSVHPADTTSLQSILVVNNHGVRPQPTSSSHQKWSKLSAPGDHEQVADAERSPNDLSVRYAKSRPEQVVIRTLSAGGGHNVTQLFNNVWRRQEGQRLLPDVPRQHAAFPVWRWKSHNLPDASMSAKNSPQYATGIKSLEHHHATQTVASSSRVKMSVFNLQRFQLRLQRELEECYYAVTRDQPAIREMESPAEYGHQVCR